ncbi:MAG TPA: ABC transporter permease, partial [Roseiarcus sp.]|nr:ABC transporter permease [Roseiarcus sp.]
FELIGFDGLDAIYQTFITPIVASYKWQDVLTKAAPLIIIALGLSLGNQAKVWNIGAEGQYVIGALTGAGAAFAMPDAPGFVAVPVMIAAGILGGMAWAAVPALLKTRFHVSEVLSTLMLVYVAMQVLNYLVGGPWKDPNGHNFPQTQAFSPSQQLPHAIPGTVIPPGFIVAIVLTLVFWILMARSVYGFSVRTVGAAPSAARYGGFDAARTVWSTLMISGGMAGLAGILEAMSQLGQINLGFPSGYGFTAIIVSFLGRLHPVGVFLAGLILAVTYVGGQVAQTVVHVPNATAGIFQATMLFFILASDILVRYRVRVLGATPTAKTATAEAPA